MKIKKIIKWILISALILLICGGSYLTYLGYDVYKKAVDEKPISEVFKEIEAKPNYVSFDEMDVDLINAFVAVEDRRFFSRYGVDFISIGRALITNIMSGEVVEGGSTITQQCAKNIYFDNSKNFLRKIAEVYLVYDLESEYSKQEILAAYLNIIYYGDNNYGIYDASMNYLHKDPSNLTVYEASLLAGFPQSPSNYQLSNGYKLINKRQIEVLDKMLEYDYISKQEYDEAISLQPKE